MEVYVENRATALASTFPNDTTTSKLDTVVPKDATISKLNDGRGHQLFILLLGKCNFLAYLDRMVP